MLIWGGVERNIAVLKDGNKRVGVILTFGVK